MGLPQIVIDFKTKGTSAIKRSQKGVALLLFTKNEGENSVKEYKSLEEIESNSHSPEDTEAIKLCFEQSPRKVIAVTRVLSQNSLDIATTNQLLSTLNFNWLGICTDKYDGASLNAFVKNMRGKGRYIKAVFPFEYAFENEAIVVLSKAQVTLAEKSEVLTQLSLVPIITGMLAYLPLGESVTYKRLYAVTSYLPQNNENDEVEAGRLVLIRDEKGYKVARGVNSLVNPLGSQSSELKKIKILEAMDTIQSDIRTSLESDYIGRVKNDYDSKLLLCGAISGYFSALGEAVLDKSYDNKVIISLDGQKNYLVSQGINIEDMTDTEILKANTGSFVFLQAVVRFVDAMEDISFILEM